MTQPDGWLNEIPSHSAWHTQMMSSTGGICFKTRIAYYEHGVWGNIQKLHQDTIFSCYISIYFQFPYLLHIFIIVVVVSPCFVHDWQSYSQYEEYRDKILWQIELLPLLLEKWNISYFSLSLTGLHEHMYILLIHKLSMNMKMKFICFKKSFSFDHKQDCPER